MPTYGRSFTLVSSTETGIHAPALKNSGPKGQYTKENGLLAYFEICHSIRKGGWTVADRNGPVIARGKGHKSDEIHSLYAFKNKDWISYDDKKSIERKVTFCCNKNYVVYY